MIRHHFDFYPIRDLAKMVENGSLNYVPHTPNLSVAIVVTASQPLFRPNTAQYVPAFIIPIRHAQMGMIHFDEVYRVIVNFGHPLRFIRFPKSLRKRYGTDFQVDLLTAMILAGAEV